MGMMVADLHDRSLVVPAASGLLRKLSREVVRCGVEAVPALVHHE